MLENTYREVEAGSHTQYVCERGEEKLAKESDDGKNLQRVNRTTRESEHQRLLLQHQNQNAGRRAEFAYEEHTHTCSLSRRLVRCRTRVVWIEKEAANPPAADDTDLTLWQRSPLSLPAAVFFFLFPFAGRIRSSEEETAAVTIVTMSQ